MKIKSISFDTEDSLGSPIQNTNESLAIWKRNNHRYEGAPDTLTVGHSDMLDFHSATTSSGPLIPMSDKVPYTIYGLKLELKKGFARHWELSVGSVNETSDDTRSLKQENAYLKDEIKHLNSILTD